MKKTLLITVAILLAVSFAVCPVFAAEDAATPAPVGYSASRVEAKDLTQIPCLHKFSDDAYSTATEFKISSVEDLEMFDLYVNDYFQSFSGVTVYLEHDLDLSGAVWTPVGYNPNGGSTNHFAGTFDGQGHVIDNFKVEDDSSGGGVAIGFFGTLKNATIKNLIIGSRASVTYKGTQNDARTGGLVGCLLNGVCTVDNCYVLASVSTATWYGGGIVGTLNGNGSIIKNSTFGGSVTSAQRSGGILSYLGNTSMTIDNCRNTGTVTNTGSTSGSYTGGIVGMLNNKVGTCAVTNCINNGEIVGEGSTNGGISGMTRGATTYTGNLNYGTVNNPADLFTTSGIFGAYYENADADKQVLNSNQNLMGQTDTTLGTVPAVTPSFFTDKCDLSGSSSGDDNTTTEPADTAAPTPTTEAPTTKAPADDKSTSAPTAEVTAAPTDGEKTEQSGGCGSVIGGSVAILLVFGMAAVLTKKREY